MGRIDGLRATDLVKNTPKVLNLKDSMKVLFLVSWYPMNGRSGNGIFAIRQAEALAQAYSRSGRPVSVDVMAVQPRSWTGGKVQRQGVFSNPPNHLQEGSVRHWVQSYRDGLGGGFSLLVQVLAWVRLLSAYRRHHGDLPTVVVAQVAWKAAVVALFLGRPYGIVEHWSGYLEEKIPMKPFPQFLARWAFRKARSVAAVSRWLADAVSNFYSGLKVSTLPNVIEAIHGVPSDGEEPLRDPRVFLHVSDLAPVKNPALLFGAWVQSGLAEEGYRLRVAGEYSPESRSAYSLVKGVDWLGILSPPELCYQLKSSRALLLTSHRETFSLLAAEALLNGCALWTSYRPLQVFYQGLPGLVPLSDDQQITWSKALQETITKDFFPWNNAEAMHRVQERLKGYRTEEAGEAMLNWIDGWRP